MVLKAALCFIINYEHKLIKEEIWKQWIEPNKDIINVYFYYSDYSKIESQWIKDHAIPASSIQKTTYLHVLPAYFGLMNHALKAHGGENEWIILLTDFCVPLISPQRFRWLFYKYYNNTLMKYQKAWWDVTKNHRANLSSLSAKYHLANSPWFTMNRGDVELVMRFINEEPLMAKKVFDGIVANESFFAIALEHYSALNGLTKESRVLCENSHIANWDQMSSATSPQIFKKGDAWDRNFIEHNLSKNSVAMFLRKVESEFPDNVLNYYIYEWRADEDKKMELECSSAPLDMRLPLWVVRNQLLIWKTGTLTCFGLFLIYFMFFM